MYEARQKVLWFAISSRAFVIFLQFLFNTLYPDHNADAFRSPLDPSENTTIYDRVIDVTLSGLLRWDAQYFVHIARYGYTYENTLAFFPMYPTSISYVAAMLKKVLSMLNENSIVAIVAVAINYICFVKSSVIFYDLSKRLFGNTCMAYKAAILYCINPASIFFSAAYTESMFAYMTFYSMLGSLENHRFVYLPIGLSTLVRSNGLINIGFPIFASLKNWLVLVLPKIVNEYNTSSFKRALTIGVLRTLQSLLNIINIIFLSIVPFIFLQIYIYLIFCTEYNSNISIPDHVSRYAIENNFIMPGSDDLTWCRDNLPMAYSKIQEKYWNVGFMKYYEFKQIPNFALAAPILCIMLKCIFQFSKEHLDVLYFNIDSRKKREEAESRLPMEMFVFIVHGLFLTLFSIFFVHIQVSTRLLSSASPLIYWYCATLLSYRRNNRENLKDDFEERENLHSRWKVFFLCQKTYTFADKLILLYFLGYLVLGCFMYSNFLPWT